MKLGGWIFMMVSWAFILSLAAFCFTRIFKKGLGGEDSEKNKEGLRERCEYK